MNNCGYDRYGRGWALVLLGIFLAGKCMAAEVIIDLNHNGMSDIWELIYGASNLDPNEDTDNDGASNLEESIAGTDPFDPSSFPHIASTEISGTNLTLQVLCELGKRYELQQIQPMAGSGWTNWTSEAGQVSRTGPTVDFISPASAATRFFRIAVSDVDTSGSGMSDWEKYQLGLDPFTPSSNGQIDANGHPVSDRTFVLTKLTSGNPVVISATDPSAIQPDVGQSANNAGEFTVTRGGFPLHDEIVSLAPTSAGQGAAIEGTDYSQLPRSVYFQAGASSAVVRLIPLANTNRITPVVAGLQVLPGSGYTLGSISNAAVVIYPSATPAGEGLLGQYYTNANANYTNAANFNPTNLVMTRVDTNVNYTWGSTTNPFPNKGYYSVRWTGAVLPQYSELYYFVVNSDDGVKLWVNDQLIVDRWVTKSASDLTGTITLQAGLRYDIRLDYFNIGSSAGVHLSWYSQSQPKQIIPTARLYPSSAAAPAAITSPLTAVAFLGQPFTFMVTGGNNTRSLTASGVPFGLSFNPTNGQLSGIPSLAGDYSVVLTASNEVGIGSSVLDLQVMDTGSSVTRELWLGIPGVNVSDIPVSKPPSQTSYLGTLEGSPGPGSNYAERIRGYFTAPTTGNYYFWITASDSAELWLSTDGQEVNKVRRSFVSPQPAAAPHQWDLQPSQRSGWLSLIAGQPYYLEVLHKAGTTTNSHWSVSWIQDPTGTNLIPTGVVPGYLLTHYSPPLASSIPGVLYSANMVAGPGVTGTPVGSATLRLSPDSSRAVLNFSYGGLSSPVIGEHIISDPYLSNPSQILFDISAVNAQPDGSYVWPITAVGTLSKADVLEILNQNRTYLAILTADHADGELQGHFTLADGTPTFSTPPPAPAWSDDHANPDAAARFLIQATFGPEASDVAAVQALGYEGWLQQQMNLPASHHLPLVLAGKLPDPTSPFTSALTYNTWWRLAVTAPDQLRQRVAFALSEILVTSDDGSLSGNARALSAYYDVLLDNAFGNFRQLLEDVTLSPTMGMYLNMQGNDKGSIITGIHANENYAREILQLFSIGLYRLWPDGTLILDSQGNLIPTYNQNVIMGFASVFTGWTFAQTNQANGRLPTKFNPSANYVDPMVLVPTHHELGAKLLLDNVMLPPAWGTQADSTSPDYDAYGLQELEAALDSIFNNQNVGPFICRQLIQRLVTSNPSRDYLYRVVQVFNNNGQGVRGDLAAVVKAILLDYEARSSRMLSQPTFGKQREPVLRATAIARGFPPAPPNAGTYNESGTRTITITTTNAHRLTTGDTVYLDFTDTSGHRPPTSQAYSTTVLSPTAFTVTASGAVSCTYTQTPSLVVTNQFTSEIVTTNRIAVALSKHGLIPGNTIYLNFTSGAAVNGPYQVVWTNGDNSVFYVLTPNQAATLGNALISKLTAGGYSQTRTNITISITGAHGLNVGDSVYLNFTSGSAVDGLYNIVAVPDPTHFTVITTNSVSQTQNGVAVYPLAEAPFFRSGTVSIRESTWNVGSTDGSLKQTPMNSPTVFNFFYPSYQFPGVLSAAGLTTPEFQLTSDTSVASQMNFFAGGLLGNTANTNGLSSFTGGNGAIVMDLGPWMTPEQTSNAGLLSLVDSLGNFLTGGTLSPSTRMVINNYVTNTVNFKYSNPPTSTQIRDRVRAVVHLLSISPDFIVQK